MKRSLLEVEMFGFQFERFKETRRNFLVDFFLARCLLVAMLNDIEYLMMD